MKRIIWAMVAALTLLSCEKQELNELEVEVVPPDSMQSKVVEFNIGQDVSIRAMTRATLTELNMTDLWVFDYMGTTLMQQIHQASTDAGFGSLAMSLEYGEHAIYFVASRGASFVVDTDSKTITWGTVRDTFHASLSMNVQPTSANSQSVALSRVVGRLTISATDVVPDGAAKFTISPSTWYYGLNFATGEAIASSTSPIVINIPASYIGTTNLSTSFYTISSAATWQTNVSSSLLASDESIIGTVTIPDVPIQRNHITTYSGGIVGAGRVMTVCSDDEWIEDDPVNW